MKTHRRKSTAAIRGINRVLWVKQFEKTWNHTGVPPLRLQGKRLRKGIQLICDLSHSEMNKVVEPFSDEMVLSEQPFDRHLLKISPLYRKSRQLYIQSNGKYLATLITSPRTLSSSSLLDHQIEYSPIEREMIWSAIDPIESKHSNRLLELRTYASNVFHEQNHRILWNHLPPAPTEQAEVRRYLNFAESLVITLDMALGDELGPKLSSFFYLMGIHYDPGTTVRTELKQQRSYRNYLQAALYATYLHLECYDPEIISQVIRILYPNLPIFSARAANRSGNLDRAFILNTNLKWQRTHRKKVIEKLHHSKAPCLILSEELTDNRLQYLWGEKLFDLFGL
jgi:hypothetical protein